MTAKLVDTPSGNSLAELQGRKNKIVIIDDEKDFAEAAAWEVEDAGYETVLIVEGSFKEIDNLVSQISEDVYGVLCDQRLRKSGFANFDGSDLVATLYDRKIPAILNTQFYEVDKDVPIRKHRHKIPVLLSKSDLDESTIKAGIETCLSEFNGSFSNSRKPYRNIVRLIDFDEKYKEDTVDVIIPSWKPDIPVSLPLSLICEWIVDFQPERGIRLIANVNSGAENPEDLYFTNFELAPEPEQIDGIS
ncbi:MAG: rhodanese-like domain-containing protein [Leptolyngbyaceae cyanobacterium SL_5_9]|nr:rhodanese-like domain-containing protein [Leptolyngbyaceae cyanobacterium SL_5_9]NJO75657.1 rhodanese-like domain-containing protein [Leptolyngbyaceae cyanobacterium RM1_406_9]